MEYSPSQGKIASGKVQMKPRNPSLKGKMWVPLGEYPSSRSQNITPYCPIQPLYNPYIGGICGYISRVLAQGYPTFPFHSRTSMKKPAVFGQDARLSYRPDIPSRPQADLGTPNIEVVPKIGKPRAPPKKSPKIRFVRKVSLLLGTCPSKYLEDRCQRTHFYTS